MLYDYICGDCGHELNDIHQSIHDECLKKCPACGKLSLSRVIYGGLGSFVKDVKTIGQAADKNWNRMGYYQKSEIEAKEKEKNKQEQSPLSQCGNASKKEINRMTPEQKKKYIITGEK